VSKTKELIMDYRKRRAEQAPINIDGAVVERVGSLKFLGVHISKKRSLSNIIPPQETEKTWHEYPDPQKFQDHPERLHHRLV
jgi:hypothetical protein